MHEYLEVGKSREFSKDVALLVYVQIDLILTLLSLSYKIYYIIIYFFWTRDFSYNIVKAMDGRTMTWIPT